MGNPTKEAVELNKKKSKNYLRAIAFVAALVLTGGFFVFVKGTASIFNTDFSFLSASILYITIFIYIFRSIRKDQK